MRNTIVATRDKRIEALRRNQKTVRFETLRRVLEDQGFAARRPAGGSSHWTFTHPELRTTVTVVERRPYVLPVYVRLALKAIAELSPDDE
jgi:predicted RNA binding protein YcfA (HicA-like mRNA interferase family)